jgi:hypothetical protein
MNKISRVSRKFRLLFQFLFFIEPIGLVLFWSLANSPMVQRLIQAAYGGDKTSLFLLTSFSDKLVNMPLDPTTRLLGFMVSMLPVAITMFGLYQLVQLFRSYESGRIFTIENVKRYKKLGYTLFASVFGGLVYEALITWVVTFHNAPGKREIAITFGSYDIITLIVGGIILLISWVMMEGQNLAEEQVYTI